MAKAAFLVPRTHVTRLIERDSHTAELSVHEQNWIFAGQSAALGGRTVVEVPVDGSLATDFIPALNSAAAQAGTGGMVILFTGHGSRAPGRRETISEFAFETIPESVPAVQRTKLINKEVLNFLDIAEKDKNGKWVPKPQSKDAYGVAKTIDQMTVDRVAAKWAVLEAMRNAFTLNKIDRLVLLTCNLGLYPTECQKFTDLIQTTVVAYRALIATTEVDFDEPAHKSTRSVVMWATTDHGSQRPPPDQLYDAWTSGKDGTGKRWEVGSELYKWILANWRHHAFWTVPPSGPGLVCTPGASSASAF